jgi:LPS export ABC transporter protein LptC
VQSGKYATLFLKLGAYGEQLLTAIFRGISPRGTYRKTRRLQIALLGVALIIIFIVLGTAFKEKRKPFITRPEEVQQPPGDANLEVKDVSYSYTNKDNVKEWDLRADKAQYFKDKRLVMLEHMDVTLYRANGGVYHLTGKQGQLNIETQNILVQGDVQGVMPDNTRFATNSFSYDNNKRIVTTKDAVFVTRDTFSMEGVGMVIDVKEEKLTLLDKVKATENR